MRSSWMVIALSVLLAAVASAAPPNGGQRIESFRSLPNWSGLWQQVGVTPDATGETVETDEELRARFVAHHPTTLNGRRASEATRTRAPIRPWGRRSARGEFPW